MEEMTKPFCHSENRLPNFETRRIIRITVIRISTSHQRHTL